MKHIKAIIVFFLLVMSSNQYFAQASGNAVDDLKFCRENGIFSDRQDVRKACLFTIFKEKDEAALPFLIKRLQTEPDTEIQTFIARVIQKLDNVEGIKALEKFAWSDGDFKVRWVCRSICKTYAEQHSGSYKFNLARLDERLKLDRPNNM